MKLWLITQEANRSYDTYDSAIVAADDEAQARALHPNGHEKWMGDAGWLDIVTGEAPRWIDSDWTHPANVTAKVIGDALPDTAEGVVLASFNAG